MTEKQAVRLGFKPLPNYTVMNSHIYDLGRGRLLSFGCIGTPNEILFIKQMGKSNNEVCDDIITLHNYDYDGYMTEEKLGMIIKGLTSSSKNKLK